MHPFSAYYTDDLLAGARRSAEVIVPLLRGLVQPRSVIDVGCGRGHWLAVFRDQGVTDVLGVDGSWAAAETLAIPAEQFLTWDLGAPLRPERTFDLVLCLEVAQHFPDEYAAAFVEMLTRLGPAVAFSAAIPYQEGVGHVNEQWPDYWVELFRAHGYVVLDCVRPAIWNDDRVDWWYAQNLLLFTRRVLLDRAPLLQHALQGTHPEALARVHPRKYLKLAQRLDRFAATAEELAAVVPRDRTVILVDQAEFGDALPAAGRRALPFLERDGVYWGLPEDDAHAVRELERMRGAGAAFLAFAWPAFWWLVYYAGLQDHVRANYPCVLENERLVVFDLRPHDKETHCRG